MAYHGQHHGPVDSTGAPFGPVARRPRPDGATVGKGYFFLGIFMMFLSILSMGTGIAFIYLTSMNSTVWISFISMALLLMFVSVILCCKGRAVQVQRSASAFQQTSGVTTMMYGVQPPPPGAFRELAAPPVVQPTPGAPIVYGPSGQVYYQPGAQTEVAAQPYGNTVPGNTRNSEDFVEMPDGHQAVPSAPIDAPPSYDEIIKKDTPIEDD